MIGSSHTSNRPAHATSRIAIVSIGGLLPGSRDLGDFWSHIRAGRSVAREAPPGRWTIPTDRAWSATLQPDHVASKRACFVEDFALDLHGVRLQPSLADLVPRLDPMFHLLLHAGTQAWSAARTANVDRTRCGIIIGNIALPTDASSALAEEILGGCFEDALFRKLGMLRDRQQPRRVESLNRYVAGLPAGILAQALGFKAGTYTLDAACASSLYAIKLACDELLAGRADLMLAGGLSRPDSLYTQMGFTQLKALSPTGCCSPFDRKADGLVVGEGCGIVALKRVGDALRDGDRILAVIAGIGLSNDIGGNLMLPDSQGQLRAMRAAYAQARWRPGDVDHIECHGTGTPTGDLVEWSSLRKLWRDEDRSRRCVIGSVKSNVGHLLTGAGAAGLIKTLLAMEHETLPPTANFEESARGMNAGDAPFEVLRHASPWEKRSSDQARRAAISAFGFGGINAHMLVEKWEDTSVSVAGKKSPQITVSTTIDETHEPIAIVGMDAHFGPWKSLNSFTQRVLGGDADAAPQSPTNWWGVPDAERFKGYFIEHVDLPVGRFRIPPNELREMLPQQSLMLNVAANALADAGMEHDVGPRLRTGVFVGIGLDLNTTNFHVRWTLEEKAAHWTARAGIDATPDQLASWTRTWRDDFGPALSANRTMGALGGIVASRIARAFHVGGPSFTVSAEEASSLKAVEVAVGMLRRGEIDSAIVGAVDLAGDVRAALGQDVRRPFSATGAATPFDGRADGTIIGEGAAAVILMRLSDAQRENRRVYAVITGVGGACDGDVTQAVSTGAAWQLSLGRTCHDAGASAGSIGLIEAHGSGDPREDEVEASAIAKSFDGQRDQPAALSSTKADIGNAGAAAGLASLVKSAICLATRSLPAIREVDSIRHEIDRAKQIYVPSEAQYWLHDRIAGPRRAVCAAMSVDGNCAHVLLEEPPEHALRAEVHVERPREDVQRFFSESTISAGQSPSKKIAFVFPGAGNHYLGMGRQLALHWPHMIREHEKHNDRLASQFADGRFWSQRSLDGLSHRDVIFGQVWLGAMIADLLRSFGVTPDALIGYSLGETTSMFAGGFWPASPCRDEMLRRLYASPLFAADLTGPCDAARQAWKLREDETVDWLVGVITAPRAQVESALRGRTRVYLLIVNTPNECVIGGHRREVERLVADLRCILHPITGVTTVHCDVVEPVKSAYRALHRFEQTKSKPDGERTPRVYSGAWGDAYEVTAESAADAITAQAVATVDFAKTIETAYADGVRVFIETGPGESCTRMIRQILAGRPHVAMSVCVEGEDEVATMIRALAKLREAGMTVDSKAIVGEVRKDRAKEAKAVIRVSTGGPAFDPQVPQEWMETIAGREDERMTVHAADSQVELHASAESYAFAESVPPHPSPLPRRAGGEGDEPSIYVTANSLALSSDVHAGMASVIAAQVSSGVAQAAAEASFLRASSTMTTTLSRATAFQVSTLSRWSGAPPSDRTAGFIEDDDEVTRGEALKGLNLRGLILTEDALASPPAHVFLNREQCLEFAIGSIGKALGPTFAVIDSHPTRVRLPDEPLMLVDRILEVEGEPASMTHGRVVTEHDVLPGAWYLDCGRIPTCIAVEAGQADLFLSGYLGIDFITKGKAVYRLLDAVVTFHRALPVPGETINYDIRINEFYRQGDTHLFRFEFDGTVNGERVLTMRQGCAGFFTEQELAAGQGIVQTAFDRRKTAGVVTGGFEWLAPKPVEDENYSDAQVDALRRGSTRELAACLGDAFASLPLREPVGLPGGEPGGRDRRMTLVHRVLKLNATGGRFGLGQIVGEADIHPNDWFLTCHFVDDRVMPGTLMYECCLHTLRVFLLRLGWVGERGAVVYEPIPQVPGQLKCRGQVTASTKKVQYEITVKEIGYQGTVDRRQETGDRQQIPSGDESSFSARPKGETAGDATHAVPYVIADALMYADGKPIVQMKNMSLRLSGLTRGMLEAMWSGAGNIPRNPASTGVVSPTLPLPLPKRAGSSESAMGAIAATGAKPQAAGSRRPAIFDFDSIYAFANGNPSDAFGDRYRVFDHERRIARLPRPPYQFLDRIVSIKDCEQWKLAAGGVIEAEYDVPADGWYFAANRQRHMPFSVLLEVALQPCGWLAAYLGSALTSGIDLSFRNLGGSATQFMPVGPDIGTLTTRIKITRVSQSVGMIIQHYDMLTTSNAGEVYRGDTYFGFFSGAALANQVGIREAKRYEPGTAERSRSMVWMQSNRLGSLAPGSAGERARVRGRVDLGLANVTVAPLPPHPNPLPHQAGGEGAGEAIAAPTYFDLPDAPPFPDATMRMVDRIEHFDPTGGPHGKGFIRGTTRVNPDAWFFQAHFYQDPVWPGSLGLESFVQLLKVVAHARWGNAGGSVESAHSGTLTELETPAIGDKHTWIYRGQVLPTDKQVTVEAAIKEIDDERRWIKADGFLIVDGRVIYQMVDFTARIPVP